MTFDEFFAVATTVEPYEFQREIASNRWHITNGRPESLLVKAPTSSGKTEAAGLAWLWNRCGPHDDAHRDMWPRRLVYCLPMRVLVEQTRDRVVRWLDNLGVLAGRMTRDDGKVVYELPRKPDDRSPSDWARRNLQAKHRIPVHILMGGEEYGDWDLYPEREAVLIGTQDMLLSRALNRGYAMSRYRWPIPFGLLNNDCLWVFDEIQLMGPGLATALQLEAFRREDLGAKKYLGSERPCISWYMSATATRPMLKSREWRDGKKDRRTDEFVLELSESEKTTTDSPLGQRRTATKFIECHPKWNFDQEEAAKRVWDKHREMTEATGDAPPELPRRTLVICNTVERAQTLFKGLQTLLAESSAADLVLLHSRFRPTDRQTQMQRLAATKQFEMGQIVVSTQVIEAGVDLSSAVLWTEIAPVPSIVQRLGRLNRAGEFGFGGQSSQSWKPRAFVVGLKLPELPKKAKKEDREKHEKETTKRYLPYDRSECERCFDALGSVTDGSPGSLENRLKGVLKESLLPPTYSLLRHELFDFFDTDSNVSRGYTDVSPFIRGTDPETDVYVFWRDWSEDTPPFYFDVSRNELCHVPIWKVKKLDAWRNGWVWQSTQETDDSGRRLGGWQAASPESLFPGATLLLPLRAGGYSEAVGWTGEKTDNTFDSLYTPPARPSDEDLLSALEKGWQSIADHTTDAHQDALAILRELGIDMENELAQAVQLAVKWHDYGKNLRPWQEATRLVARQALLVWPHDLRPIGKFSIGTSPLLNGKTDDALQQAIRELRGTFRPGLRHEVASALALRQHNRRDGREPSIFDRLSEYLVMCHHGKVRKTLRDELPRSPWRTRRAADEVRGVREGTSLDSITVLGEELPDVQSLSIECRKMGRGSDGWESWTKGVLRLLDHFGPFRLAFYEALIRAADMRASAAPLTSVTDAEPWEHSLPSEDEIGVAR